MDPVTAAILIGTAISAFQAQKQIDATEKAAFDQKKRGVDNQNAAVAQGFKRRTQGGAQGFGGNNTGNKSSQQGGVLQGIGEGTQASIVG